MGVYSEIANYNEDFIRLAVEPKIINDVDDSLTEKDKIKKEIFTTHESDCLANISMCDCGYLTGDGNLGIKCPHCQTVVTPSTSDLEPRIWMRSPEGVEALINPQFWAMLVKRFKKGQSFSLMHWITMPSYVPDGKFPEYWQAIVDSKIKRGYNNFVQNFDQIMEFFFNLKGIRKRGKIDPLYELIQKERHKVFSNHIPLVNRTMLVIEKTNLGRFLDNTMFIAIDAITGMIGIDSPMSVLTQRQREERTIKSIDMLADYYAGVYENMFSPKEGIFRKQCFGGRSDFSSRCVISSLTGPHQYDEIRIPWGVGIGMLRTHLVSKLLRRGFTPNDALLLLYSAMDTDDEEVVSLVSELFDELIDESDCSMLYPDDPTRHKGIPVTMERNPTLGLGSIQLFRITQIKKNRKDKTMGIPILNVSSFNADRHLV